VPLQQFPQELLAAPVAIGERGVEEGTPHRDGAVMARQEDDLDDFGRFAEPALMILISLADGQKHGYAMTDDIEQIAGVRFGPGTLYGAITRLEGKGLIERMDSDDRRNPYRLTALGEKALRARLASLQAIARVGQRRLASA
jgi:DNA-binding PadR family transcriptional regulator